MPAPYEELIDGEWTLRLPPRASHESICAFLHRKVQEVLTPVSMAQLLAPRSKVILSETRHLRPDLSLMAIATNRLCLVAEVISQEDHHADTVLKKSIYEELRIPRLWIIDPRYENVEVYHASQYGLVLKETLMVRETLVEKLLPGLTLSVQDIFSAGHSPSAGSSLGYQP